LVLDSRYTSNGLPSSPSYPKVKIAILDTGIALKRSTRPETVSRYITSFKDANLKAFNGIGLSNADEDGHGTNVAILAARVCLNADIYVARIAKHNRADDRSENVIGIDPVATVSAIEWAIKKEVDIINMSFGWRFDQQAVHEAIEDALKAKILLFAATSNYGLRFPSGIAFPARDLNVIGVDSADGIGASSKFNPQNVSVHGPRFSAPGEDIPSVFPRLVDGHDEVYRLSGTSFASPIAAGIAGLILEFARQPPLSLEPRIHDLLKTPQAMKRVLLGFSTKLEGSGPFNFLQPWYLFEAKNSDGGDAFTQGSPRMEAAEKIIGYFKETNKGYGEIMYQSLAEMRKTS
jgi:subtilisin family serine protease